MKFKVTKKEMKSNYNRIIKVGYCNAQFLLKYIEPIAYSTRAEGWACDYYDINGVLLSTGYAPIESKNTNSSYEIVKRYDNMAREIACNYALNYEEQKAQVSMLLQSFVKEVA